MDALDTKFDRHVSFLLQEFEGQSFPCTLPQKCEETNTINSLLQEWQPDKEAELQYEIVACVRVLDVLGIEVVTRETLRACLTLCTRASWRRAFLSGRLQKAKEFLLHVAAIESLPRGFIYRRGLCLLVPQMRNKNMIVCFLKIAKSTLNEQQIRLISKLLNVEADSRFKQCMKTALRDGEWCVVDHMLRMYNVESMDKTTLHQVLVKAMELRQWKDVEACLKCGADIATACTETGFDLNARSGENNTTVLHDAMFNHKDTKKEMVQALLRAGADPNITGSDGETLLCSAVFYRKWDLALLLLMCSRAAGTTVSHTFRNGEPVLHFVSKKGQSDLVRELFTTQTDPLVTDGKGNTLIMAALGGADSWDNCGKPEPITPGSQKENVMRVLIQSGVATHQALLSQSHLRSLKQKYQNVNVDSFQSPMWQAVKRRKLRIARMLYAAGASCHEEIHELVKSEFIGHEFEETNQRDTLKFSEDFFSHFHSRYVNEPDDPSACCHTEIHELANSEYVRQNVNDVRNNRQFLAFLNDIFSHVRSQGMHYTVGIRCPKKHDALRYEYGLQFVREKIEELKNWCDIMDFLDPISSHPRSLRDICALTISHLIGCGPQRDERAASLGLPDSLCRRVLQDHVISSDFLKDYPPDPEDTQPSRARELRSRCGPPSCALTISHLIGCGPQRDERAASLGLPDSLCRRVLQDHVISSDFLKDYPPDPEDTQPSRARELRSRCGPPSLFPITFVFQHTSAFPIRSAFRKPLCSCQIDEDFSWLIV